MVESINELRVICQGAGTDKAAWYGRHWWSRNFARRISIYITRLLLYTPITANQATLLMILWGTIATALFAFGDRWLSWAGVAVLQLWYIFDNVDGEVARYRKTISLTGEYLDHVTHLIVHPLIFAGISIGVYQNFPGLPPIAFGFAAALSYVVYDGLTDGKSVVLLSAITRTGRKLGPGMAAASLNGAPRQAGGTTSGILHSLTKILFLWRYPTIMNVISVAVIANTFVPVMVLGGYHFNIMYLILVIYGVSFPVLSAGLLTWQIVTRNIDRMYDELRNRE